MRALVTGGAGHLGKVLVKALDARGHDTYALDIDPGVGDHYFSVDINDAKATFKAVLRSDIVYHLASRVGRIVGDQSPECTLRTNVVGTYNVASACVQTGARLVHVSTSEGYGRVLPQAEEGVCRPVTWYGATKNMGEKVVDFLRDHKGLDAIIIRPFMMYSETEPCLSHRSAMAMFAHSVWNRIPFFVHRHAERSWLHYDDASEMLVDLAEIPDWPLVMNIGNDEWLTMEALADLMGDIMGRAPIYTVVDPPTGITLVKRPTLDIQRSVFGREPRVKVSEGVRRVCERVMGTENALMKETDE